MYGQIGIELLKELKTSEFLPPYREDKVREVIEEMNLLFEEVKSTMRQEDIDRRDPRVAFNVIYHHSSVLRNKRAILAYLTNRLAKIQDLRWEVGNTLLAEHKDRMSEGEIKFMKGYSKILGDYMQAVQLDLTADLQPPKDLYIIVRVEQACGTIQTANGPIHLSKNSTHYVLKKDVEHLIRQGHLTHVV
eukprot:TRINITY_DN5149_c0_g1::TRINITY_DN5149_c0_g1_i1::g.29304::m.29304 TRINITY_DN5149_c0_g1::TRINITY_DN5149_c0_g1_i1::g.29304  ORF type:complete len:204 (-),score=6.91,sp/Q54HR6/PSF1_DICDI/38.22/6e-42,Sld5/PF05916.6/2.4e-07,Nnf1/PF03980.9/0.16 TRINITY_DN5149_c0_g1_i1:27-596(-)